VRKRGREREGMEMILKDLAVFFLAFSVSLSLAFALSAGSKQYLAENDASMK